MTQKELASEIGTTQSYISMIEDGTREPSFEVLRALRRALKTSYDYLIDGRKPDRYSTAIRKEIRGKN